MEFDFTNKICRNKVLFIFFLLLTSTILFTFKVDELANFLQCTPILTQNETDILAIYRDKNPPRIGMRNAVLVMASYRGGSTLAGEIFNRNKDVLYYFGKYGKIMYVRGNKIDFGRKSYFIFYGTNGEKWPEDIT